MGEGGKRKARQEEAPAPPSHRILTSDELGLLKVTEVPAGNKWEEAAVKQRWGQPDKQQGVLRLQTLCQDWDPDRCLIATARSNGRVTLHCPAAATSASTSPSSDGLSLQEVGSFRAAPPACTSGRTDTSTQELRGLRFVRGEAAGEGPSAPLLLLSATAGGSVALHRCSAPHEAPASAAAPVVQTWEEVTRLQTVSDVQAMDVSCSGRHVAVGGEGHQLKVWDLSVASATAAAGLASADGGSGAAAAAAAGKTEPLFAGKAGKPSRSGLQDLAHVTALSYIPGQGDQQILVGTAKHKLWLYDMRAGRKPQAEVVWGEGRITALLPQPDGQRVWVGNGRGQVEALDLRGGPAKMAMGHALKGSAGSIRALSLHPSEPLIASVSLDRHLRLHHTGTRALLSRVYLKQALTGVAWLPIPTQRGTNAEEEEEEADRNGDVEEQMEEEEGAAAVGVDVGGRRAKKGRKSGASSSGKPHRDGSQKKDKNKKSKKDK
ncbi:hypothetical protein Agub_g12838 [Astrephomene gubernaculifera]|uniref:Uncharacterized protein n=1 Tax=Astrephomene gubernaculifera TaxID=47775 RepID=A0AAD3DYW2_9CHLO|nr:hypothetical protein Agub_g12838 [Astrephomene gubernaculifera]